MQVSRVGTILLCSGVVRAFPGLDSLGASYRIRTGDLRITSVFWCVARGFKPRASFRFTGCCWWRPLAVDGGSGASRGHLGGTPTGLAWTGLHGDELQPKLQSAEAMNIKLLVVVEGMALQFDHAYTDP